MIPLVVPCCQSPEHSSPREGEYNTSATAASVHDLLSRALDEPVREVVRLARFERMKVSLHLHRRIDGDTRCIHRFKSTQKLNLDYSPASGEVDRLSLSPLRVLG